jgi:nitrite reductase/ring-hydroxylating ferredoxin subunit
MTFRSFCPLDRLPPDEPVPFVADGQRIAVVRVDDEVFAVSDQCTHADWPMCDGYVEDDVIVCPVHGARFSLRTGAVLMAPGDAPLASYPVRIVDGEVQIDTTPREY